MFLVSKVKVYLSKFHEGVEISDKYSFITVNTMESMKTVGSPRGSGGHRGSPGHVDWPRKSDLIDLWRSMSNSRFKCSSGHCKLESGLVLKSKQSSVSCPHGTPMGRDAGR